MKCSAFAVLSLFALSSAHDVHVREGNLREGHTHSAHQARWEPPPPHTRAAPRHDPHPRTGVKQRASGKTARSTGGTTTLNLDDVWDGLKVFPTIEICIDDDYYEVGNNCTVPVDLDELVETGSAYVFESKCLDQEVIIEMDLETGLPEYVVRMHPYNAHYTELHPDPNDSAEDDGCRVYAIVTSEDIDPNKEADDLGEGAEGEEHRRSLFESGVGVVFASDDTLFPLRPEHRQLGACSEYKQIRLAVQYDSTFCTSFGGTAEKAAAAIQTNIEVMNKYYQEFPLCFNIKSCSITGSCSAGNDPYAALISSAETFCGANSLLDKFQTYLGGTHASGCDTTHFYFGTKPDKFGNTAGCDTQGALCVAAAVGASHVSSTKTIVSNAKLVAHELGHNLNMINYYPEDKTYIMGTGEGNAGFKPERMSIMQDYVNQVKQQNPSCTSTTTAVTDMSNYVQPDHNSEAECNERKCSGECTQGHVNYAYSMEYCHYTCTKKECVPVDKLPESDCNNRKCNGECEPSYTYYEYAIENCRNTCLNKACVPVDKAPEAECNDAKCSGYCESSHSNYAWSMANCRNTCLNKACAPVDKHDSAECRTWCAECAQTNQNYGWMMENCRKTCTSDC